jgi:hypothetical protein
MQQKQQHMQHVATSFRRYHPYWVLSGLIIITALLGWRLTVQVPVNAKPVEIYHVERNAQQIFVSRYPYFYGATTDGQYPLITLNTPSSP